MPLASYQLLAQLGAGTDGASYRAADAAGAPVEVRILGAAASDPTRRRELSRRLRLAALLHHPAAVGVRELGLEQEPLFAALEWVVAPTLAEVLAKSVPSGSTSLRIVRALCAALTEAHHLGLAHGRLTPSHIRLANAGTVKLDFTGVEVGDAPPPDGFAEFEASCRAPETAHGGVPDASADLYGLGMILCWLLRGRPGPLGRSRVDVLRDFQQETRAAEAPWMNLIPALLADDPTERPPARSLLTQMPPAEDETNARTVASLAEAETGSERGTPDRVGRFRLVQKLGEGGMGSVFRAEDVSDGTVVALKLLRGRLGDNQAAWHRMRKEARLLAEVNNPYVANLIELNEQDGVPYLVLEFVRGESLAQVLARRKQLTESEAAAVMADAARALADAHRRGIVHRDVKPENILVANPGKASDPMAPLAGVKLCDFGLARHVLESESLNLTGTGSVVGTPLYASPEQCTGLAVDVRTDVYALGATLFHLLAGRPPFVADTLLAVTHMHVHDPPPALRPLNPEVSDGMCRIIEKALAKAPDDRHADAEAFLLDLERLRRGEAVSAAVHPHLPPAHAGKVLQYEWTWELESAPEQLWPYVADTERLNRAAGVPAVEFTTEPDPAGGARRHGKFQKMGIVNAWREHPFEWVEGRRLGVLREYSRGVLKWLASVVELKASAGGGTTLTHQIRVEPRGLLGRVAAAVEIGARARRGLDRVYRRIDAYASGKLGRRETSDPFEPPPAVLASGRRRLERLIDRLMELHVDPAVAEKLGDFLLQAAPQEIARIRPLALADRLGLDPDKLTTACLHGAREGLLELLWDILCPICRIPSGVKGALASVGEHEHCPACAADFKPDFAESVEMIFRAHPQIRPTELRTYCVGGPAHSPHVAAQVRVAPGETVELPLTLGEGSYRLRGPQLPYALDFRVRQGAPARRWDLRLAPGPAPANVGALQPGRQTLALTNEHPVEVVVRVERTAARTDALTAARASTMALFRELFPGQAPAPGRLAGLSALALLVTDLDPAGRLYEEFGDARAFSVLHGYLEAAGETVRREGGAVVRTVGEGLLASFMDTAAAVRAALELAGREASGLRPRVAVHYGPVTAATINDRLDYFGSTVSQALRLTQHVRGGELVLTRSAASDPEVAALLRERGLSVEVLADQSAGLLHRIEVAVTAS